MIAATNRDLKKAIEKGEFREELFWRLNVITVHIPPLRDRRIDIPEFIRYFLGKFSQNSGKSVTDIEPSVLKRLVDYSWKGNVRELENAIEHGVLVAQSNTITWNDIPSSLKERMDEEQRQGAPLSMHIEEMYRNHDESAQKLFREALTQSGGDVVAAAKKLGMSRATFYRRLKKYGLTGKSHA